MGCTMMEGQKRAVSAKRQMERRQRGGLSFVLRMAAVLGWVGLGVLMLAYTPPTLDAPSRPVLSSTQSRLFLRVHVVDLVSRQPISGAILTIKGVDRMGISDQLGRSLMSIDQADPRKLSVTIKKAGYMATTETMIDLLKTPALVIGLPPMNKLKQADQMIRDPRTLDPNRQQTFLGGPATAPHDHSAHKSTSNTPINTPINGLTYPLPSQIKVKKTDGSIISLDLEEYLKGVLPREIGSSFPLEAMKAQAIAARTYTIRYTQGGKNAICTTTQCQVWGTTQYAATTKAVMETKGQVAVYVGSDASWKGKLAGGYFAASCAGATINSEAKWSFRPFLRAVSCIENKTGACGVVCKLSTCGGGRCSSSHSTCWGVFGHRIGLCQRGAQAMGKCGKTYIDIVKHYYTDTEIANLGSAAVDGASFVRETIPALTTMQPGQSFTKEWVLKNTGTTTWSASGGYKLVRTSGTAFGAPAEVALKSGVQVAPGATQAFQVPMKAPTGEGSYKSQWRLAKASKNFGPDLLVSIVVKDNKPKCEDKDQDGFSAPGQGCPEPFDCDDTNKNIHPNAREICGNQVDEDCKDGPASCEEGCVDNDKDGFFAKSDKCGAPGPFDCDDTNKDIHPNAREICGNQVDEDCKDGPATCPANCEDKDQDGYGAGAGCPEPQDCNDNDKNIYPGAPEICGNNIDEDCRDGDKVCSGNTGNPPTTGTTNKKLGEGCTSHSECASGLCAEFEGKGVCSKKCSASHRSCPTGMSCLSDTACWPNTLLPPGVARSCQSNTDCNQGESCEKQLCTPAKQGCGCSTSGNTSQPPVWMWLWLAFGLLWVSRRKRLG